MNLKRTPETYNAMAVTLHWLSAMVVFGLFGLGLYMVELGYYDPWYRQGPDLHKGIGVLLFIATIVRLIWRVISHTPPPLSRHSEAVRKASYLGHLALYALMLSIMLSGYLISTADGRSIDVFGWFEVPASVTSIPNQADVAGQIHLYLAWSLIALVVVHVLAALKHHFIEKDGTLKRMWFR
ncbi:cytochrome b [Echinimonas agarilytica]|uniref:Cytochrome b n=1 Tax=Echinimonas agarilytica TaxID=1215918 RepID=A0AA41W6U0_9GAMM|nr:cytochrome b [Echinimonas agarilytica]MCM2680052.1 cytochrome b [Echinimonas agarilytica]